MSNRPARDEKETCRLEVLLDWLDAQEARVKARQGVYGLAQHKEDEPEFYRNFFEGKVEGLEQTAEFVQELLD